MAPCPQEQEGLIPLVLELPTHLITAIIAKFCCQLANALQLTKYQGVKNFTLVARLTRE